MIDAFQRLIEENNHSSGLTYIVKAVAETLPSYIILAGLIALRVAMRATTALVAAALTLVSSLLIIPAVHAVTYAIKNSLLNTASEIRVTTGVSPLSKQQVKNRLYYEVANIDYTSTGFILKMVDGQGDTAQSQHTQIEDINDNNVTANGFRALRTLDYDHFAGEQDLNHEYPEDYSVRWGIYNI